jgi:hypothetical protein
MQETLCYLVALSVQDAAGYLTALISVVSKLFACLLLLLTFGQKNLEYSFS